VVDRAFLLVPGSGPGRPAFTAQRHVKRKHGMKNFVRITAAGAAVLAAGAVEARPMDGSVRQTLPTDQLVQREGAQPLLRFVGNSSSNGSSNSSSNGSSNSSSNGSSNSSSNGSSNSSSNGSSNSNSNN
jgi:uncharacterized membrane protein YgcG